MLKSMPLKKGLLLLFLSECSFAAPLSHPWYIAAGAGISQGIFDSQYKDETDIIPQNTEQTLFQHAYTADLLAGYNQIICNKYILGGELSGGYYSGKAKFASGAATLAFSDKIYLNYHVDLSFTPGLFITNTTALYGKIGVAFASIKDTVNSPAGFNPVNTTTNNQNYVFGAIFGIGIKKWITDNMAVFSEYNFHDYGTTNFSNFNNFTAAYSHSAHIYSQDLMAGVAYFI